MVVMQEDKFKVYYNLLANAIVEYEAVLASAQPIFDIAKNLLEPHLNELFRVIQPVSAPRVANLHAPRPSGPRRDACHAPPTTPTPASPAPNAASVWQ